MAQAKAPVRGIQLLKSETEGSVLRIFDRRNGAFVAAVDVAKLPAASLDRAALHGITQNLMDSSNKLEGDARIAHIKAQAEIVQAGGWASAPVEVNIEAAKAKMIAALVASGKSAAEATKMVDGLGL
jgi:hypothetical protein